MAKVVTNEKGFLVIEVTSNEVINRLGEHGALGICDCCGRRAEKGYYVAVLNEWLCPEDYNSFINRARRHKEDIPYEESHFKLYKQAFGIDN